MHYID